MISKGERRWVIWFGIGLMLITTLPYIAGYFSQTAEWRYSGLALAEEDGYSYLAKMLSGAQGAWLFRTPYTLADQKGLLGFLPYLLLGKLTSPPGQHEQIVALFHLFRIAGGVLVCWATYDFIALFVEETKWRRVATVIAMAGGGLGGLSIVGLGKLWLGPMALEFYSPETFGFLGLLAVPHLAWARALLLWGLKHYLSRDDNRRWGGAILTGVLWIAMGFFQPLVVVVAWLVLAVHLLGVLALARIKKQNDWGETIWWVKRAVVVGVISSPVVLYNFLSFQFDPFLSIWQNQNYLPSPPISDYLLAYAILLPLIVLGIRSIWKKINTQAILLLAWICAFPILAYLPYNLQRRLPEGLWVVLAILAVLGLSGLSLSRFRLATAWVSIGFLPAIILLGIAFRSATATAQPSFRPAAEISAFDFLNTQAVKKPAVAAAFDTSTALPAYADVRVPIGHGPESLHGDVLLPKVYAIYDPAVTDADRREILDELNIDFVFVGPLERQIGSYDLGSAGYLSPVFTAGEYTIYRVEASLDR